MNAHDFPRGMDNDNDAREELIWAIIVLQHLSVSRHYLVYNIITSTVKARSLFVRGVILYDFVGVAIIFFTIYCNLSDLNLTRVYTTVKYSTIDRGSLCYKCLDHSTAQ